MELVPVVFSSGWASGVNAYATILVLGLFGRFTDVEAFPIPDVLTRTDVLVAAALLFTVEFVTDKIPYLDSAWDLVSTAIRPSVGAVIALLVSGDASSLDQAVYATLGGGTALASHAVKSGLRLALNASPEPFSNAGMSVVEDSAVATVVTLAVYHPWWAFGVALALLVLGLILLFFLLRHVRRGLRRWRGEPRLPV
ncbi:MAG TPA: DUF4126 domain-containing protein [Gaiellaceae bacterium]|nr:DUF4126 domain-containing protein [Gaiellaceae bacterium]